MPKPTSSVSPSFTTTIALPMLPLHPGCVVCRIWHQDQDVYDEMTRLLLYGQYTRQDVQRWLAGKGFEVSAKQVYTHYNRDIKPHLDSILALKREALAQQLAAQDVPAGDLDEALGHTLLSRVLHAFGQMDLERHIRSIEDPGDAIEFIRRATDLYRAVADVERAHSDTSLKEKMADLRELEILARQGNLDQLVEAYLRRLFGAHPEIYDAVMRVLRPAMKDDADKLTTAATRFLPAAASKSHAKRHPRKTR